MFSGERAVPSVAPPPDAPLPHSACFRNVSARVFDEEREKARLLHIRRTAAKQGVAPSSPLAPGETLLDVERSSRQPTCSLRRHYDPTAADDIVLPEELLEVPDAERIEVHFEAGGVLTLDDAQAIILAATEILRAEPNVLRMAGPITVVGDVHGQYYDLLTIFRKLGGDPSTTQYVFLGDYVDRGSFSTEIVLLLFARKILQPYSIWLLRGNHESGHLTSYFNFAAECRHKYDDSTYELFLRAFDCLPLAAVINGEIFCVHGGLSPFIRTIEDIDSIVRFRDPPQRGAMCDLLWSDPMDEDEEDLWPDAMFLHNDVRACSYVFTHAATCDFLSRNNLACLVRAHEAQEEGYRLLRKVPETGMPSCISIFSAPNYCGCNNSAAILLVDGRQLQVKQFHSAPAPYTLPNFLNGFTWSLPFVQDKLACVIYDLLQFGESIAMRATTQPAEASDEKCVQRNIVCLPRVLRHRGTTMRAKILSVARFIVMLHRTRQRRCLDATDGGEVVERATAAAS